MPDAPKYWAFLSYCHRDKAIADWLHGAIETYRVPRALVGRETPAGTIAERLAPVFRDRNELPASDDLGAEIRAALAESRVLIVLCSPAAAASRWVNEEIATFKRLHPDRTVLAAILAGEPFASELPGREAEECFPPALRTRFDETGQPTAGRAEPIAADLREEGDGRRLGKLKLVAGMLGVGLDQLVRREGQRRQKRLALVAAASLAGMVVTSGLALVAVNARDEARDQRAEAEDLVGFMLGDLRAKLEPLGRLDVLDSVGAKALAYYQGQDRSGLTEEGLAQQARALTLIGEIANLRGDLEGALNRFRAAQASTAEALARAPDDEQRIFDHAQNMFWVAYIAWQRGDMAEAAANFEEYKDLAYKLVRLNPGKTDWRLEAVSADTNLGMLLLEQGRFADAVRILQSALAEAEKLTAAVPNDAQYQNILLETLAWLSDAQERQGRLEDGIRSRERQLDGLRRMAATRGEDTALKRKAMAAHRSLGRLFASRGDVDAGLRHLQLATRAAEDLGRLEPNNTEWLQFAALTQVEHGALLLAAGRGSLADPPIRAGCEIAQRLVERDHAVVLWLDALRQCLIARAESAAYRGHEVEALTLARQAVAVPTGRSDKPGSPVNPLSKARAHLVEGDQHAAIGDIAAASRAWRAALPWLSKSIGVTPSQTALKAQILGRLGNKDGALKLHERLAAMGYRHPGYI